MSYCEIQATATITVSDNRNLLASWKRLDPLARLLVGAYRVETPLTESQLRRMPAELRARLAR